MNFYVKLYNRGKERLVAVCDENIRGKSFMHNGVKIIVQDKFYGTELYSADEALKEIKKATSVNAFGSFICQLLIDNGLAHPAVVLWMNDGDNKVGHLILIQ